MVDEEHRTHGGRSQSQTVFYVRKGDTAYTLQRGSNAFGQFLLVFELRVGGHRRSVIIPGGKAQNGWKVFGLELRKMLDPDQ